jgi:signal recognition particle subunit SRP54
MFQNLSEKLDAALHVLKEQGKITEVNVAETLKEIRRALIDADVNFKIRGRLRTMRRTSGTCF